jgi:hypothetical protein
MSTPYIKQYQEYIERCYILDEEPMTFEDWLLLELEVEHECI